MFLFRLDKGCSSPNSFAFVNRLFRASMTNIKGIGDRGHLDRASFGAESPHQAVHLLKSEWKPCAEGKISYFSTLDQTQMFKNFHEKRPCYRIKCFGYVELQE
jgi:hypothetical protein